MGPSPPLLQPYQAVMKLIIGHHGNENEIGKMEGNKTPGRRHSQTERKGRIERRKRERTWRRREEEKEEEGGRGG